MHCPTLPDVVESGAAILITSKSNLETESKIKFYLYLKFLFWKPYETDFRGCLFDLPLTRRLFCIGFRKLWVPIYVLCGCCGGLCCCCTWCRCCCTPGCPRTGHGTRGSRHRSPEHMSQTPGLILRDTLQRSYRHQHLQPHSHTQSWGNSQFERCWLI